MEPIIEYLRVGREGWKIIGGGEITDRVQRGGGDYRKSTSS